MQELLKFVKSYDIKTVLSNVLSKKFSIIVLNYIILQGGSVSVHPDDAKHLNSHQLSDFPENDTPSTPSSEMTDTIDGEYKLKKMSTILCTYTSLIFSYSLNHCY